MQGARARARDAPHKDHSRRWRGHAQRGMRTPWRRAVTRGVPPPPRRPGAATPPPGKGSNDTKGTSKGHTAVRPRAQTEGPGRLSGVSPTHGPGPGVRTAGVHARRGGSVSRTVRHPGTHLAKGSADKGKTPTRADKSCHTPSAQTHADTAGTSASDTRDARTPTLTTHPRRGCGRPAPRASRLRRDRVTRLGALPRSGCPSTHPGRQPASLGRWQQPPPPPGPRVSCTVGGSGRPVRHVGGQRACALAAARPHASCSAAPSEGRAAPVPGRWAGAVVLPRPPPRFCCNPLLRVPG
ncbi:WAS/WASL-interacting protein family member 3-like [Heterocephalus glaber]|uniref:WAS/WASL-interacting protein family member 3-like n=1 Tax=Heterocephalus glaber TaxID=10181 RepID=A0AAX6STX8_HETGA|nr:WAS/WASL-interacting protein family member 3-like [Heterocephalus glaber]